MERAGELATLPFTYTAGTLRRSGWVGESGARSLELGPQVPGNRVLGLKAKCLGLESRSLE